MTAVSDSVIFRNIFSTAESAAIWSDRRRTEYYLLFEKCLAEAQSELDIVRSQYVSAGLLEWILILVDSTESCGFD
jgi:3-carboxy-cis,cis-muconate cycloisomerase